MATKLNRQKWAEFMKQENQNNPEVVKFWEEQEAKAKAEDERIAKEQVEKEAKRKERSDKIKETHKQHDRLVEIGAKWLMTHTPTKGNMGCSKCSIVTTEIVSYVSETPDVLGFANNCRSVLLEAKISREDFKRDSQKLFRKEPERGMGQFRMYITPKCLINTSELPPNWGLLEVNENDKVRVVKYAECQISDRENEMIILASIIKRIGQNPPEGVSIRCYTHETKNKAMLHVKKEE